MSVETSERNLENIPFCPSWIGIASRKVVLRPVLKNFEMRLRADAKSLETLGLCTVSHLTGRLDYNRKINHFDIGRMSHGREIGSTASRRERSESAVRLSFRAKWSSPDFCDELRSKPGVSRNENHRNANKPEELEAIGQWNSTLTDY